MRLPPFALHAAWSLGLAHLLSFAYELWRATARAGTSRHDSMRTFLGQVLWLYLPAAAIVAGLVTGGIVASWVGLVFSVAIIGVSTLHYNPVILMERQPGAVDWIEDIAYTGLAFVAAAMLAYDVIWRMIA